MKKHPRRVLSDGHKNTLSHRVRLPIQASKKTRSSISDVNLFSHYGYWTGRFILKFYLQDLSLSLLWHFLSYPSSNELQAAYMFPLFMLTTIPHRSLGWEGLAFGSRVPPRMPQSWEEIWIQLSHFYGPSLPCRKPKSKLIHDPRIVNLQGKNEKYSLQMDVLLRVY